MSIPKISGQQARELLDIWAGDVEGLIFAQLGAGRSYGDLFGAAPALAETVAWLYGANSHPGDFGWRRWPLGGSWSVGLRDGQISIGPEGGGLGFRTPEEAEDAARALLAAVEEARP